MRIGVALCDKGRDDILAEIMFRGFRSRVFAQELDQKLRLEDIDSHAGQRARFIARHMRRVRGLFDELSDPVGVVDRHHAEGRCIRKRDLDTAHRHVGAGFDMLLQQKGVVLLIDVISGEDENVFRRIALDDVDILRHRVGGAQIPVPFIDPLRRGQNIKRLVALGAEEAPAALQVADQAVCLVLCRHTDTADAGIDCVGQREIDDACLSAEIDCRFGTNIRQLLEPAAASTCKDEGHGFPRQLVC